MKIRYGHSGVHPFDRKTGLNILVDEMSVARSQWSLAPRYVSIALTNACELACSYCYASKVSAKVSEHHVRQWASDLSVAGCFGLGLGGGEPTLFPGFANLCRDIHKETNLAITMTTHGHQFSSKLVDRLSGNVEFIRLSMDGIGPTYERLRGRSFVKFKEKLALVRSTARFGVNYVVNDDTLDDLPSAAEFAFESGAEEMLLLPEVDAASRVSLPAISQNRLSIWVQENFERYRLATSAHGGECIAAPVLFESDPAYQTYDFMHVDAQSRLRSSAFSSAFVSLSNGESIIDSITAHRARELGAI